MSIESLLQQYPPVVAGLARLARDHLLSRLPQLQEELDLPSKIIIYRVAPGMMGIVFTLIPSKKGVKLGIFRGRELDDPACLMQGRGKVHATIPLSEVIFNNPDFQALLDQAAARARARVNPER